MANVMAWEPSNGLIAVSIEESGKITKCMATENSVGPMAESTPALTNSIKNMVKVLTNGQMAASIKVTSTKESSMAKAFTVRATVNKYLAFGTWVPK